MNYNILKAYLKSIKISQKELAESIGFTEAGFNRTIKKDSLKVRDLEKIAKYLQIPIINLLNPQQNENYNLQQTVSKTRGRNNTTNVVNDSQDTYIGDKNNSTKNKLDMLQLKLDAALKEIELKDEIIKLLKKE